jgi:hypothetical protein
MATAEAPRISVEEARRKMASGEALLICAYPDEAKCEGNRLAGSITLSELGARLPTLGKDQELIFYCA